MALSFLAQMSFAKGDHARALALYREALASLEHDRRSARDRARPLRDGLDRTRRRRCARGATRLPWRVRANEEVGSPKGTGLALLGLAAVEAAEGRSERAVAIAAAAHALSERAGVVIASPDGPGRRQPHRRAQGVDSEGHGWTASWRTRVCCPRRLYSR